MGLFPGKGCTFTGLAGGGRRLDLGERYLPRNGPSRAGQAGARCTFCASLLALKLDSAQI